MISRLSLEGLRSKTDLVAVIADAGQKDSTKGKDWYIEYAYALLRDGWVAGNIIDKIRSMVDRDWQVVEDLIYRLAARAECGLRPAEICMNRVGYDLSKSDLDDDRGLRMLCWLFGKKVDVETAGIILRRLIFGLDERRGWTDKIPWFGTGSVTKGIRRLRVANWVLTIVELFWPWRSWYWDMMEGKFGRFAGMTDELIKKF